MRYEEKIVDEVQSLSDIVEVISNYIPLKRSGRTFKALCPFHQEKSPSFIVNAEKQIFHCFGCGVGGNVFSFLMKYENLNFPEALRNLAGRVNVTLPEPSRKTPQEVSESEILYEIYRLAHEYYVENLKHPAKGERARQYLAKRGIDEEIWKSFGLGWSLPDWRGLYEFLSKKEIKEAALLRSGLVLRGREGSPYDVFRGRILFPIHNLQGRVIAFGGRGLGDEMPKYLNSSESPIFRKRRELYGLHVTKRFLSPDSRVLIVEGYFDFLRVFATGFQNVVATLGTALTEDHVRILKRFTTEAVVVYDGDPAGEAASLRGLEVFLEGEMSVKVAAIPAGKDPDTFIQDDGASEFKKVLEEALDFFDFKWKLLTRRHSPADAGGLVKISNDFLESFSKIKNPILLDRYVQRLAGMLRVSETSLRNKLAEIQKKVRGPRDSVSISTPTQSPKLYPEEGTLVALLLEAPLLWLLGAEDLSVEDFYQPAAREAFQVIRQNCKAEKPAGYAQMFNRLGDESVQSYVAAHSIGELSPQEREKAFSDCLKKIQRRGLDEKLTQLRRAIADAEGEGEKSKVTGLLEEYRTLLSQKS